MPVTKPTIDQLIALMPDGMDGFMKEWGLVQFAEKVETVMMAYHAERLIDVSNKEPMDTFRDRLYRNHDRTSCSDEKPINAEPSGHGCARCNAIHFTRHETLLRQLTEAIEVNK